MESGGASGGGGGGGDDQLHGLKFGKKIYFEDAAAAGSSSGGGGGGSGNASATTAAPATQQPSPPQAASPRAASGGGGRRGRAAGGPSPAPAPARCQVDGCNVDLTDVKPYYCRHKVCKMHSKEPRVVVNGLEQRFCQQCSRSLTPPPHTGRHCGTPPLHPHLSFTDSSIACFQLTVGCIRCAFCVLIPLLFIVLYCLGFMETRRKLN